MGLDRQLEQLCSVYAERSDAELLGLHENRDDLTEVAQEALAQVMKERGISVSGVPVAQPDAITSIGASIPALDDDEVELQTFDDAFRLNEALRLLTKAKIAHRVVNWDEVSPLPGGVYRPVMQLGLIVRKADKAQARNLLQVEMKLFPAPEGDDNFEEPAGFVVVDIFSRSDALRIAQAFGSAGISFLWNDGREKTDPSLNEDEVRIEVYQQNSEVAMKLAEQTVTK